MVSCKSILNFCLTSDHSSGKQFKHEGYSTINNGCFKSTGYFYYFLDFFNQHKHTL